MYMLRMSVDINGDFSANWLLKQCGLEPYGPVQCAIDRAVIEYMKPYWAWDTGRLANSADSSDIGSGIIEYPVPYASEMYYGVRENGKPVNYHLDKNPQAGPFPFERMMADHFNDIVEEANRVARNQ